jgi:hypothetical protein
MFSDNSNSLHDFADRRNPAHSPVSAERERRQFANRHDDLSPAAKELAVAIDQYKLRHRRRFIDYEEILAILHGLGYAQQPKNGHELRASSLPS